MRLPFKIFENNMGSQYHHYIFGIILQKEENWNWIYHNYMGMVVKHFYHSHGDFMHDGIYSGCDRLIKKYRVQGPVKDLQQIIQSSIRNGVYVILNINEQNLSHRQAYKKYYFRHDLLIYGYNEKTNQCLTAGFNENMEFCEIEYPYAEIEEAYRSMPNEWDYELFLIKWNEEYVERIDWSYIQRELRAYIEGKNPTRQLVDEFLENVTSIEFVGESYKEYYGIQLYDYLEDRIKGQNKLFRRNRSNETIGANDMRTMHALGTHERILKRMYQMIPDVEQEQEILDKFKKLEGTMNGVKVLMLRYMETISLKDGRKVVKMLRECKRQDREIGEVICGMLN